MSRVLFLAMDEFAVIASCTTADVGISALEKLPMGGTRLVCKSVSGAEAMRVKLRSKLIKGGVLRHDVRPRSSLW